MDLFQKLFILFLKNRNKKLDKIQWANTLHHTLFQVVYPQTPNKNNNPSPIFSGCGVANELLTRYIATYAIYNIHFVVLT